jgi:hypothetical protein
MTVIQLTRKKKRRTRAPSNLVPLNARTGPGRFFSKMVRDIRQDLGGSCQLTRVAEELIEAFAGCIVALRYQTHQILLGEELDLTAYSTLASTALRIGNRLGLERRMRDVGSLTLSDMICADQEEERRRNAEEDRTSEDEEDDVL